MSVWSEIYRHQSISPLQPGLDGPCRTTHLAASLILLTLPQAIERMHHLFSLNCVLPEP